VRKIRVTGIMYVEPEDVDTGPNGPLTEEAYNTAMDDLPLDDIKFELLPE
jgi:hypothetical protein